MTDSATANRYRKPAYRWYVLGLLTVVYTFNFIDRQVLVIVQEQIRVELGLMDWQLGMLSGFVFAVFYSILGVPIAHWSEQIGRKRVISISLAFWSLMTALMGAAQNFAQLALLRVGVGVGEAGGSPPSHSIISDIFPRRRRAFALSVFSMGVYFGYLVAYSAGGWAAEQLGWRTTFVVVGLPGVLVAALVAATIKEPPRGLAEHGYDPAVAVREHAAQVAPGFLETLGRLWSRRSFRYLALAGSLQSLAGYGVGNFMPSFIIRAHDMAIGDIGWRLALITGLGGAIAIGVGFGSQNVLNNFISGLILLAERPVRAGDLVDIQGLNGTIEHIGARSTRVKTGSNVEIILTGDDAYGLAIDPADGRLYWTDQTGGRLRRALPDGSDVEDLVLGGRSSLDTRG